jgi:hypothetical protein
MDKLLFWPLAIATLLGGAAALWYFKDKWAPAKKQPATQEQMAKVLATLTAVLAQKPVTEAAVTTAAPMSTPAPTAATATPASEVLSRRLAQLLQERQRLITLMTTLAQARGSTQSVNDPTLLRQQLHLPEPIDKAIAEVLGFTDKLEQQHEVDIRLSDWVTNMTEAAAQFLQMLIDNAKQK